MKPRLELWQLRYFVAVAEELSFRRAADRLSITQPPLTRQIQALEDMVGARLFDRTRSGVSLTSAGRFLLDEARGLLSRGDTLLETARERFQQRVELRLGLTTVVDPALFTWLEPALKRRAPGMSLVQKRQISQRSIADLRKGVLDAALIGLPSNTSELTVERLQDDPLVAALPRGHRLARRKRVSLLDLQKDPLFWFTRQLNPAYFDHFEGVFRRLGYAPARLPEPADHHVLLGLIADGQGSHWCPPHSLPSFGPASNTRPCRNINTFESESRSPIGRNRPVRSFRSCWRHCVPTTEPACEQSHSSPSRAASSGRSHCRSGRSRP